MPRADIEFEKLKVKGEGFCIGGKHPDPPLDAFPLLAWSQDHPVFGRMTVHTEDGKASVEQIALALCELPDVAALADRFGTSSDHVDQAIAYATSAGFLGV
jgi:hypothetical protein